LHILVAGEHTLFVRADAVDAIAELDESNNLAVRAVGIPRRVYLPLLLRNFAP
jgi:subtilase family serine protease